MLFNGNELAFRHNRQTVRGRSAIFDAHLKEIPNVPSRVASFIAGFYLVFYQKPC